MVDESGTSRHRMVVRRRTGSDEDGEDKDRADDKVVDGKKGRGVHGLQVGFKRGSEMVRRCFQHTTTERLGREYSV